MTRVRSEPSTGHNSGEVNAGQLQAFVERIEKVRDDISMLKEDEKEIFAELKANGFDAKIVRKVLSLRAMDADKRAEEEALIDIYWAALGQLKGTPLGDSAVSRAFS